MLSKENLKLAAVALFCLLMAWTGPSIAHGVHARFAHNADKVDNKHAVAAGASLARARGKLVAHDSTGRIAAKFLPPSVVKETEYAGRAASLKMTYSSAAWTRNIGGPSFVQPNSTGTSVTGDGGMQFPLTGPLTSQGLTYGLGSLELCYSTTGTGHITDVWVWGKTATSDEVLLNNFDNRASATRRCDTITVNKRAPYGATVYITLNGGNSVNLLNVRATWTRASATLAPRGSASRAGGGRD